MKIQKSHILKTIFKLMTGFNYDRNYERTYEMIKGEYRFFLPNENLPSEFKYPFEYIEFSKQAEVPDLDPWDFFYSSLKYRNDGLKKRYPDRILVPFARRGDNDDVACFDGEDTTGHPRVFIIHDFASPGWEGRGTCKDFNDWLILAKRESEEWKQRR